MVSKQENSEASKLRKMNNIDYQRLNRCGLTHGLNYDWANKFETVTNLGVGEHSNLVLDIRVVRFL